VKRKREREWRRPPSSSGFFLWGALGVVAVAVWRVFFSPSFPPPPHKDLSKTRTLMMTASSQSVKAPFLTAGLRWFHHLLW
jgi:hypothetical protein